MSCSSGPVFTLVAGPTKGTVANIQTAHRAEENRRFRKAKTGAFGRQKQKQALSGLLCPSPTSPLLSLVFEFSSRGQSFSAGCEWNLPAPRGTCKLSVVARTRQRKQTWHPLRFTCQTLNPRNLPPFSKTRASHILPTSSQGLPDAHVTVKCQSAKS